MVLKQFLAQWLHRHRVDAVTAVGIDFSDVEIIGGQDLILDADILLRFLFEMN